PTRSPSRGGRAPSTSMARRLTRPRSATCSSCCRSAGSRRKSRAASPVPARSASSRATGCPRESAPMNPVRGLLLAGSQSEWLRRQAGRRAFVRKAVSRFMPGETLDEALEAAHGLSRDGLGTILTHLGENVTGREEAEAVVRHYREMIGRLASAGLDA